MLSIFVQKLRVHTSFINELIRVLTQCTIPVVEENTDEEGQCHYEQIRKHGEAERKHV